MTMTELYKNYDDFHKRTFHSLCLKRRTFAIQLKAVLRENIMHGEISFVYTGASRVLGVRVKPAELVLSKVKQKAEHGPLVLTRQSKRSFGLPPRTEQVYLSF